MPAKKDSFWGRSLESLKAHNPTWGAGRILKALEQMAAKDGREDAPKERWVGNYLQSLKKDPKWSWRQTRYGTFHWPESMERGDLPWEAAPYGLQLLREMRVLAEMPNMQPSLRGVEAFWHVSLTAPDAPFAVRLMAAGLVMVAEATGEDKWRDSAQWLLACAPWRGPVWEKRYTDFAFEMDVPVLNHPFELLAPSPRAPWHRSGNDLLEAAGDIYARSLNSVGTPIWRLEGNKDDAA
jgi:hypothetical protein